LPGGDIGGDSFDAWHSNLQRQYDWLPAEVVARLADAYGTRVHLLLQGCRSVADMGEHFGAGLYQREVEFLFEHEWARSAEDVLWRRSKLGLCLNAEQAEALDWFVRRQVAALQSTPCLDAPLRRAG
jgi:glycerol-3-phosphate dehydrogenase